MEKEKKERIEALLQSLLEEGLKPRPEATGTPEARKPKAAGGNVIRRRKGQPDKRLATKRRNSESLVSMAR